MAIHDIGQLGPIPVMNRARYRRAAAFARPGQREAHQHLNGCATGRCGLSNEVVVGGARFPVPEALNQPFGRGGDGLKRYRPLASMVGQTLSLPSLAAVSENDPDSKAMLRATNLASVVAVILMKVAPKQRKGALALFSGSEENIKAWTESVMGLATKLPGGLGIVDAIRFSLAMHYLIGLSHDTIKRESMYATAYRQAVKVYRDAEERVKGGKAQTQGLGTVSLAATLPKAGPDKPASTAQSKDGYLAAEAKPAEAPPGMKKCEWWDAKCNMENLALAIQNGANTVAANVQAAGKNSQEALNQAANWAGDILCKGLKAIVPEPVGGFICTVLTKGLELFTSFINSFVEVIVQLVDGLVEFVKAIVKLDLMGAVKALLNGITKVIFVMPPIGPVFSTFIGIPLNKIEREKRIKRGEKDVPKSLIELADAVSKRSPFFIITLVLAIVAVVSGPGRNSIGTLIIAVGPMVAVITAAVLQQNKQFLKLTEVALATAIEKIIKITVVVVQGVMTLVEMFKTLWQKVRNYFERQGGVAGGATTMANNVMKNLSSRWDKFWNTLTGPFKNASADNRLTEKRTLDTKAINDALMEMLTVGPEVIYVIAGDDEELKSAIDDGKSMLDQAGKMRAEAESIWNQQEAEEKKAAAAGEAGGGPAGKGSMPLSPVSIPAYSEEHLRLMAAVVAAGPLTEQAVAKRYFLAKVGQEQTLKKAAAGAARVSRR